jgi:hypothetical protein
MAKKLDLKRIQAALNRAAYDAMHGPPEARSGRFVISATPPPRGAKAQPAAKRK